MKTAGIMDTIGERAADAGAGLKDWYGSISPDVKKSLLGGLIGAGTGAAALGGLAAATPQDPENKKSITRQALLGAILGGTSGAALPAGLGILGSGVRFGGEGGKPVGSRIADRAVIEPAMRHPALLAAGVYAGASGKNREAVATLVDHLKADKSPDILSRLKNAITTMHTNASTSARAYRQASPKLRANINVTANPKRLAAIPAVLGAGWLADKYIRGEY
jgi:hypothetical protein